MMFLLSGPIMLWHLVRHLRRLPNDSAVPYRGATFYSGDGSEISLDIPAEFNDTDAIQASISAIES